MNECCSIPFASDVSPELAVILFHFHLRLAMNGVSVMCACIAFAGIFAKASVLWRQRGRYPNANEKVLANGVEINECVIIYTKMNNVRIN